VNILGGRRLSPSAVSIRLLASRSVAASLGGPSSILGSATAVRRTPSSMPTAVQSAAAANRQAVLRALSCVTTRYTSTSSQHCFQHHNIPVHKPLKLLHMQS
jgi:hypothetical protein